MTQTAQPHTPNAWQGFAASSIGKAHLDVNLPNQDAIFLQQQAGYTVAVVCDGAGSAKLSQQGAGYFSQAVGELLMTLAAEFGETLAQKSNVATMLRLGLNTIRQKLLSQTANLSPAADAGRLRDYHTTVTAVLVFTTGEKALLVQIGDSPLLSSRFAVQAPSAPWVDYFTHVSLWADDHKNEYVNETHFITQDNWQECLRIEWIDTQAVDCLALMSDGCGDLVLSATNPTPSVYRPFFANLLFNLCTVPTQAQGNAVIEQALANPATYRLTGDDKSLVVLLKNPTQYQGIEPIVQVDHLADTLASNLAANLTPSSTTSGDSVWHNAPAALGGQGSMPPVPTIPTAIPTTMPPTAKQPTDTPAVLPPSATMSETGKQRRNTALLAGTLVIVGAGVLGWMNQAKLLSLVQPSLTTRSPVAATQPAAQGSELPPLVFSSPSQPYGMADDVIMANVGQQFFIQLVMAIPSTTEQPSRQPHKAAASLGAGYRHTGNVNVTLLNPNRPPFNLVAHPHGTDQSQSEARAAVAPIASVASTLNASQVTSPQQQAQPVTLSMPTVTNPRVLEQPLALTYQVRCQPIAADAIGPYQALGLVFAPNRHYQYCRIDWQNNPDNHQAIMDTQVSRILVTGGLAQLIWPPTTQRPKTPPALAEPQTARQAEPKEAIVLYYLPNHFSPVPVSKQVGNPVKHQGADVKPTGAASTH